MATKEPMEGKMPRTIHPGIPFLHPDLPPADNPPAQVTAAPPQEQTPQEPPAETTPAPEPKKRLLAGKYENEDALEEGYRNSTAEAQRLRYENEMLRSRAFAPPMPAPESPLKPLEELGIPPQVLENAIQSYTREEVRRAMEPVVAGMAARQRVTQRFPDFVQSEERIAAALGADAQLTERFNRLYQADPLAAMEWAYFTTRPTPTPRQTAAEPPASGALPQGRPGVERSRPETQETNAAQVEEARRYYETYGDERPFLRARLRGIVPDSHLEGR